MSIMDVDKVTVNRAALQRVLEYLGDEEEDYYARMEDAMENKRWFVKDHIFLYIKQLKEEMK